MIKPQSNTSKFFLSQFLNERISFPRFLLINENGENVGVTEKRTALQLASDAGLDLFCVTPQANPPVCKILDFSKHVYQLKKKEPGKLTSKNSTKEAKFSFAISENDTAVKIRKIVKWLEDGSAVKIVLFMRGREQQHKDIAVQKVNKIVSEIQSVSPLFQLRNEVKLVGSMYNLVISKAKK